MPIETRQWDSSEHLDSPEAINAYIEAAFEDGEPAVIAHALGVVAKARGMTDIAREAGVAGETLDNALGENGDPRLSTLVSVVKALGFRLTIQAADAA